MDDTLFIELQRLCKLVHQRGLRELSLSRPDFTITVTAVQPESWVLTPAPVAVPMATATAATETPAAPVGYAITSPLVGTYYRASSPDTDPFVEIGDAVEPGQVIGIVEAMKVFNEIVSDQAGTVIELPAKNGQLVHAGTPLVVLDTII